MRARARPVRPRHHVRRADAELQAAVLEGLFIGRDNKALLVARNGQIVSLNALATQLCEATSDDLVGRATCDLILEPIAASPAASHRWETELVTLSGARIPVEIVREPLNRLPGALVYAIRDLRERRELAAERERRNLALLERERELQIQNLRFDTAINNMPQGLAMLDGAQRLVVANQRFGELLGIEPEGLSAGTMLEALLAASPVVPKSEDGGSRLGEGMLRLADGRLLAVIWRPMAEGGIVVTTEDVTERERNRRQLEESNIKLERSNQELQNFAYVASHDLQEPLRKIETFIDRIMRRNAEGLSLEAAGHLERIQHASRRMRALINDLLAYARLGNDAKPPSRVNLAETLTGVLSDLQVRIEETGARIEAGALASVMADPTHMRQLFQNLIANALKFSRKGVPPVIRIGSHIEEASSLAAEGAQLVLTVADNGIGFDNQHKEQIFKLFQRLHGKSEYEGTGVGLATCRKIVERYLGSIDASGRPGDGATFTIRLPLSPQG